MRFTQAICLMVLLGVTCCTTAAVQGEIGVSSTAQIDISVVIEPTVRINNVSDIQIDIFDVNEDAIFTQEFCVRGTPGGKYSILATGSASAGRGFGLTGSEGVTLGFHLTYSADLTRAAGDELLAGVPSPAYDLRSNEANCGGQTNASLTLTITSDELHRVPSGTYTGFLTLYIAPQ